MAKNFLDFGNAFRNGSGVCDYTACIEPIRQCLRTISALIGRPVTNEECRSCERSLRQQYLRRLPELRAKSESDTHLYETPWAIEQGGTKIFLKITLVRRRFAKVVMASSKMLDFEVSDWTGNPLGAACDLPFYIKNYRELAYGVRSIWGGRFPHGLLSQELYGAWRKAGASCELPQKVFLCDTPSGERMEIEFAQAGACDGSRPVVTATLLLDGGILILDCVQPTLFMDADPQAFDEAAFEAFKDAAAPDFRTIGDWRSHMSRLYSLYSLHRPQGILSLCCGSGWKIFNTAIRSRDGRSLFAGMTNRGCDGRFTRVLWLDESKVCKLAGKCPPPPSLHIEPFPSQHPVHQPQSHILAHASRWADKNLFAGIDERGRSVFSNGPSEVEAYDIACSELKRSIAYATANPDAVAYGYYDSAADRADSNAEPVCAYLPAFFSDAAKELKKPDAAFVARFIKPRDGACYWSIPTILKVEYALAPCRVLGLPMPDWVVAAA